MISTKCYPIHLNSQSRTRNVSVKNKVVFLIDKLPKFGYEPGDCEWRLEHWGTEWNVEEFITIIVDGQLLIDLHQAILNRQQVWMRYYSANRGVVSERVVYPYHLHNFQGDWFLVAFDTFRSDFRLFLVGRIQEMKLLKEKFAWDEAFSAEDWIGSGFQLHAGGEAEDVAIWFSPNKAQFIRERMWHPSQKVEEQPDGSLILHLKTGGLVEVRNWVLQFADDAEVLKPDKLREDVTNAVKKLSGLYDIDCKAE